MHVLRNRQKTPTTVSPQMSLNQSTLQMQGQLDTTETFYKMSIYLFLFERLWPSQLERLCMLQIYWYFVQF